MAARAEVALTQNDRRREDRQLVVDRRLVLRACIGLAGLLGIAYLCGALLRDPIVATGRAALESFGLMGLFLGVIVTDSSPLPLTNEPLLILAISAEVSAWIVFTVVSAASVTAGLVGYTCGFALGTRTPIGPWMRRRYPQLDAFMSRYGAYGVAIAAFFPIPFALSTWTAGMTRVGLAKVMAASLVRIPKTAFYLWLILEGWAMGTS